VYLACNLGTWALHSKGRAARDAQQTPGFTLAPARIAGSLLPRDTHRDGHFCRHAADFSPFGAGTVRADIPG